MATTCPDGYRLSNGRCIKIRAAGTQNVLQKKLAEQAASAPDSRTKNLSQLQTEAAKSGISTKGGVVVETRGQKLAREAGQQTQFSDGQKFAGAKSSEFVGSGGQFTTTADTSFADAKRPKIGENEDPQAYQLRLAQFDAAQFKKAFEAEQKLTAQVKGAEELRQKQDTESLFQSQARPGAIVGAGKEINPEYTKLTTEEKILNAQLPPEEQVQQFLTFGEEDLTAAQRVARQRGTRVMIGQDTKDRRVADTAITTFTDPETGKTKKGTIKDKLFLVKDLLGDEEGDQLAVREDGSFYLKDEKGEEVDPIKRAEAKVQEQITEANDNLNENFREAKDRLMSIHRRPDGGITSQGRRALADLQADYNKSKKNLDKDADELLDKTIRSEKKRQIEVDTRLGAIAAKAEAKDVTFASQLSAAKLARLNELKAEGMDDLAAIAQVEREYADMKKDPEKLSLSNYISSLSKSGVAPQDQFSQVYEKAGKNMGEAFTAMKARYGEAQAKAFRSDFQRANGWDEEQIASQDIREKTNTILSGGGDEMALDTSGMLLKYAALDKTGLLQEEFARNVIASPDTNFREKTIAQMALAQLQISRQGKLQTKKSVTKDRFGNIILVDPFTGAVEGSALGMEAGVTPTTVGLGRITPTTNAVVATKAKQMVDNPALFDQIKKSSSEQEFEQIGREAARLRQERIDSGVASPIERQAADLLRVFNESGSEPKIGVGNPELSAAYNQLLAEQGGKRIFGQDSGTIADIKTQIRALKELKESGIYKNISGPMQVGNIFTGVKGDALTLINSVLSSQTLNSLAEAKGRGITFGALSEGELGLVQAAAGRLASRAEKDDEGKIDGFAGSESAFLKDMNILIDKLEQSVVEKTGGGQQELPPQNEGAQTEDIFSLTIANEGSPTTHSIDINKAGETFQSHGSFQMNRDTARKFAQAMGFTNTDPESQEFANEWDKMAQEPDFVDNEKAFIKATHFDPQIQKLKAAQYPEALINNPRFQQLVMDVAVNSGANTELIINALRGKKIRSVDDAIKLITEARKRNIKGHSLESSLNTRFETTGTTLTNPRA